MTDREIVGRNIYKVVEESGRSMHRAALDSGVNFETFRRVCYGKGASLDILCQISRELHISMADMFKGTSAWQG